MPDRDVEQIMRSVTAPGIENVYFLGPFAERINFAAQQSRALNLAYALIESGLIKDGTRIAIIGGGVAGLTLTTALHLLRHKVSLFEANSVVLARQRHARHRLLHPTVNQWPYDVSLCPTTAFPFFDWSTDFCHDVLQAMADEWEKLAGAELHTAKRLHLNTTVMDYNVSEEGVWLETVPDQHLDPFDKVIYTVGFEEEHQISGCLPSYYWVEDNAEHIRDKSAAERFAVSGTGDGGLIDAIRLSYNGISAGELALKVATALTKEPSSGRLCEAAQLVCNGEDEFQRADPAIPRGPALWEAYNAAVHALPFAVKVLLERHLVSDRRPVVHLVGRQPTPVESAAAAIHKLLVTYSIHRGTVRYTQGSLKNTRKAGEFTIKPSTKGQKVPTAKLKRVITRHGAPNALTSLLGEDSPALIHIEGHQRALADDFAEPVSAALAKLSAVFAERSTSGALARTFWKGRLSKLLGLGRIWPHIERAGLGDRRIVLYSSDHGAWHPDTLFGLKVEKESVVEAPER